MGWGGDYRVVFGRYVVEKTLCAIEIIVLLNMILPFSRSLFSLSDTRPHVYTDARKIQLHQLKGFFIEIQTHERFKRTLLIRTKHSLQILGVISSYKTTLQQQLNGEKRWKMRWKDKPLIGFWLSYVVFLSIAWKRLRYVVFLSSSARKRFFHHCIEKQPRFFQALDRKQHSSTKNR